MTRKINLLSIFCPSRVDDTAWGCDRHPSELLHGPQGPPVAAGRVPSGHPAQAPSAFGRTHPRHLRSGRDWPVAPGPPIPGRRQRSWEWPRPQENAAGILVPGVISNQYRFGQNQSWVIFLLFVDPCHQKGLIKKILLIPDDKCEFQDGSPLLWPGVIQVYPNPRRRKADLEYTRPHL